MINGLEGGRACGKEAASLSTTQENKAHCSTCKSSGPDIPPALKILLQAGRSPTSRINRPSRPHVQGRSGFRTAYMAAKLVHRLVPWLWRWVASHGKCKSSHLEKLWEEKEGARGESYLHFFPDLVITKSGRCVEWCSSTRSYLYHHRTCITLHSPQKVHAAPRHNKFWNKPNMEATSHNHEPTSPDSSTGRPGLKEKRRDMTMNKAAGHPIFGLVFRVPTGTVCLALRRTALTCGSVQRHLYIVREYTTAWS